MGQHKIPNDSNHRGAEPVIATRALDPSLYKNHLLHDKSQDWPETNCYIDVWIEILNHLDLDPHAMLGIGLCVDFDGDQWTFYKPSHEDLYTLYGIDVQELNIWKSLLENTRVQLKRGRLVLAEVDAFYLPDTVATDYRQKHTKTTIGIQSLDESRGLAHYFHNGGFYEVSGEDYKKIFRVGADEDPHHMPFFVEFVRLDRLKREKDQKSAKTAADLLNRNLERIPRENPFLAYQKSFENDLRWIKEKAEIDPQSPMKRYHAYAFANTRQFGSAFSMAYHHLHWLGKNFQGPEAQLFSNASRSCQIISQNAKSMLLKLARATSSPKPTDFSPMLLDFASQWDMMMNELKPKR